MTSITSEAESFFLSFLLPLLFIPFYDFSLGLLVLFILIFWISFYGLDSFGTFSLRTFIRWILFFGTQSILWKEKKKNSSWSLYLLCEYVLLAPRFPENFSL